jgi:succinylglutamate desuccinylase
MSTSPDIFMNTEAVPLLREFSALRKGDSDYSWHHSVRGKDHDFHVVFSAIIHGNETGSLPGVIACMRDLNSGKLRFGGRVSFVLGNPEATHQNLRFLESDLNRVFLDSPLQTHEARRAKQIMPIFDSCDLLLDLHQTILAAQQAFYIFPWTEESGAWARAIGAARVCVDATPDPDKPALTRCADDYVKNLGKPAVTIELGKKGINPFATATSDAAIRRTLSIIDATADGKSVEAEASKNEPLVLYRTAHREAYPSRDHRLREGLINFQPVQAGEILSAPDSPEIRAAVSGMILFPKYPPPDKVLPKEIFRLIRPEK